MNRKTLFSALVAAACVLGVAGPALGQGQAAAPAPDLARQAQNPIASLISVPLQNNTSFNVGEFDRDQNTLNIQPVIPFGLGGVNLITRTIIPIAYRPDLNAPTGGVSGLGDINATFFFSPSAAAGVTWGVGPIISFPSATDDSTGTGKWTAGPSAVVLTMPGKWVIGALVNNVWSFAGGDENDADVSSFLLQYFVNYNLPNRWYLSSAPIMTANWKAAEGNQWTVPVGGGFGKIFSIGGQPVNGQVQAFWNVVSPESGSLFPPGGIFPDTPDAASWTLRLQLQFLFPQ